MANKKAMPIILSVLASAAVIFGLVCVFAAPPEDGFELTNAEIAREITLGEEIHVAAALKNKQIFFHIVRHSASLVRISIRKADEEPNSVAVSDSKTEVLFMFQSKKQSATFMPEEKGDFTIDVFSYFTKRNKSYGYHKEIKISVV
ncbi:MAG: hypothetical protein LBL66_07050 [Clostridiales bacterium]|nr:hypothetical protein [Clostridiales bacterium]